MDFLFHLSIFFYDSVRFVNYPLSKIQCVNQENKEENIPVGAYIPDITQVLLFLRGCDRNLYRSIFLFHPHFHTYKTYYSPGCLQSYGIFDYVLLLSLQSAEMLLLPQRILPVSLHLQMPDTHPSPLPAHYVLPHATAEPASSSHLPDNFHQ